MKIRELLVNPKSSTCVSVNLNQKTCIENGVESLGTHKHAMLVQVSKQKVRKSCVIILKSHIIKQNVQLKSYNMKC